MGELLSIIVPVFNGEKYLRECVDSVLAQTYDNLELILVDDESNDSSLTICKTYEKQDARVKVFSQKHSGVSTARNLGLEKSSGEFIAFVDADDFVDKDMYSILIQKAHESSAEIVHSDYSLVIDGKVVETQNNSERFSEAPAGLMNLFANEVVFFTLWVNVIKRSLILEHEIRFTDGCRFGEDLEFIMKCVANAHKIAYVFKPLYFYRKHSGSAIGSMNYSYFENSQALIRVKEYLEKLGFPESIMFAFGEKRIPLAIFSTTTSLLSQGADIKEILKILKNNDFNKYLKNNKYLSHSKKLYYSLWSISPKLLAFHINARRVISGSVKKLKGKGSTS